MHKGDSRAAPRWDFLEFLFVRTSEQILDLTT